MSNSEGEQPPSSSQQQPMATQLHVSPDGTILRLTRHTSQGIIRSYYQYLGFEDTSGVFTVFVASLNLAARAPFLQVAPAPSQARQQLGLQPPHSGAGQSRSTVMPDLLRDDSPWICIGGTEASPVRIQQQHAGSPAQQRPSPEATRSTQPAHLQPQQHPTGASYQHSHRGSVAGPTLSPSAAHVEPQPSGHPISTVTPSGQPILQSVNEAPHSAQAHHQQQRQRQSPAVTQNSMEAAATYPAPDNTTDEFWRNHPLPGAHTAAAASGAAEGGNEGPGISRHLDQLLQRLHALRDIIAALPAPQRNIAQFQGLVTVLLYGFPREVIMEAQAQAETAMRTAATHARSRDNAPISPSTHPAAPSDPGALPATATEPTGPAARASTPPLVTQTGANPHSPPDIGRGSAPGPATLAATTEHLPTEISPVVGAATMITTTPDATGIATAQATATTSSGEREADRRPYSGDGNDCNSDSLPSSTATTGAATATTASTTANVVPLSPVRPGTFSPDPPSALRQVTTTTTATTSTETAPARRSAGRPRRSCPPPRQQFRRILPRPEGVPHGQLPTPEMSAPSVSTSAAAADPTTDPTLTPASASTAVPTPIPAATQVPAPVAAPTYATTSAAAISSTLPTHRRTLSATLSTANSSRSPYAHMMAAEGAWPQRAYTPAPLLTNVVIATEAARAGPAGATASPSAATARTTHTVGVTTTSTATAAPGAPRRSARSSRTAARPSALVTSATVNASPTVHDQQQRTERETNETTSEMMATLRQHQPPPLSSKARSPPAKRQRARTTAEPQELPSSPSTPTSPAKRRRTIAPTGQEAAPACTQGTAAGSGGSEASHVGTTQDCPIIISESDEDDDNDNSDGLTTRASVQAAPTSLPAHPVTEETTAQVTTPSAALTSAATSPVIGALSASTSTALAGAGAGAGSLPAIADTSTRFSDTTIDSDIAVIGCAAVTPATANGFIGGDDAGSLTIPIAPLDSSAFPPQVRPHRVISREAAAPPSTPRLAEWSPSQFYALDSAATTAAPQAHPNLLEEAASLASAKTTPTHEHTAETLGNGPATPDDVPTSGSAISDVAFAPPMANTLTTGAAVAKAPIPPPPPPPSSPSLSLPVQVGDNGRSPGFMPTTAAMQAERGVNTADVIMVDGEEEAVAADILTDLAHALANSNAGRAAQQETASQFLHYLRAPSSVPATEDALALGGATNTNNDLPTSVPSPELPLD